MSERRIRLKLKTPLFFFLFYVILSGVILGFYSGGFLVNFKQLGFSIVSSVQKDFSTVANGVTTFFTAVGDLATLREEYEILQEKLEDYEYLQRNNADIKKENARLKEQLGFATDFTYKNYPAQIIARDPNALYSGITLNKGSRHNIRKGMAVLAIQNGDIGPVHQKPQQVHLDFQDNIHRPYPIDIEAQYLAQILLVAHLIPLYNQVLAFLFQNTY